MEMLDRDLKIEELASTIFLAEHVYCRNPFELDPSASTEQASLLMLLYRLDQKPVAGVAKLDRIDRDAELLLRLTRESAANGMSGFLFCDLPYVDDTTAAGRMVLTVMASMAEFQAHRISEHTTEALRALRHAS